MNESVWFASKLKQCLSNEILGHSVTSITSHRAESEFNQYDRKPDILWGRKISQAYTRVISQLLSLLLSGHMYFPSPVKDGTHQTASVFVPANRPLDSWPDRIIRRYAIFDRLTFHRLLFDQVETNPSSCGSYCCHHQGLFPESSTCLVGILVWGGIARNFTASLIRVEGAMSGARNRLLLFISR
jgi:hypothetical protein